MNILKIAFANIRKRKGAGITFLVMVMLAALMLSISLSLIIGGAGFYDKKVDELNAPHFTGIYLKDSYKPEFTEFAENYEGKKDLSVIGALCAVGKWHFGSESLSGSTFLMNETEVNEKSFFKPNVIDKQAVKADDRITLPISFKASGVKSGDKINLELNNKSYAFTVYGFYEDAVFGASTADLSLVYIDTEYYAGLENDSNYTEYVSLTLRFKDTNDVLVFRSKFAKIAKLDDSEYFRISYDSSKNNSMMFINLMSIILIAFSLIILLIAFIVVGFSISNSIAEDIATIGALKSIGYKNKALKLTQAFQYLLIAAIGSIAGVLISLFTFGFLGNIIASTSGLLWLSGANILPIILTVILICGLTCLITLFATRKYKRITPINALRQGDSNHSFRKNFMPLEKYKMPINLHLGFKRFFGSLKNNITLCAIVTLLVFVSSMVFTMSYNLNNDRTAMINMVGLEMAELYVQVVPGTDIDEVNEAINADEEVSRTKLSGSVDCEINGFETSAEYFGDYSGLLVNTVVKGEYPQYKNEITLGAVTAKAIGKGVEDTVSVEINGKILSYVVVGITQNIANGGEGIGMLSEAVSEHDPDSSFLTIYIYLNEGFNTKLYSDHIKNLYGNKILMIDTDEAMDSILSSMGGPFAAISVVMIAVTVLIIAFVLFLIISALIRKQKKELGIMKAIGYKNNKLIVQMLITFLPSLLLGSAIGIVLGFALVNPVMSLVFISMGLLKTYFIIPVLPTILIGLGIFGVSVAASYLISSRLKKISPQKLIVEQ